FHCLQFCSYIPAREVLAHFRHLDQSIRNWPHFHLAQMQHDKRRTQSLREINRLKSLSHRALALPAGNSGKLVTIRRSYHHFDGEGTKIMQTAETNLALVEHFLNSGNEREANTVAQLDQLKSEFRFDFAQHFVSGGVSPGVPASGKRD